MLHRLAVTGYAVCLKAFSREHRDRYGREMVEAFERELSELEANRGSWSALRFVVAACLDAVSAGLGERRRRASGSRNSRVVSERAVIPSGAEALDAVVRTIRLALRRIRRSPSFTTSVVVILALGIGANAVMFGVVDRLLLSPPQHIIDAEDVRLLHVQRRLQSTGELAAYQTMSYPDYQDFLAVDAFTDVAAYTRPLEMTVGRGEAAGRARVVGVTANLFPLLGVQPASGRFFTVQVDTFADDPTAVLAHEYWVRAYGRDTGILGRTIDVGSVRLTVIGIAPAGFTGAELGPVDIWIPMSASYAVRGISGARYAFVQTVARMRPGVSVEAAEAEATARHRARDIGSSSHANSEPEVIVAPIIAALGPNPTNEARVVLWLTGVSLVVLLIACFNVASLLFARSIRTRQEIAVRLALGMSYRRLIAELVTEILVLTTMGAGAALLVARVLSGTVHQSLLPNVAFSDVSLGGRLLGFTLVATLTAGLLSGLIPALQARKVQLADALRAGGPGVAGHRSRTRVALIIGQISLSVVLLVGAGLFVRSLRTAQELDLGFDPQNIVVVALEFNEALEPTEHLAIYERALDGIQRLPGVHNVGLTRTVPFESTLNIGVQVPGLDSISQRRADAASFNKVSSGYFEAMGLTIVRGRGFEPYDDGYDAPPVAVVSESMARALWPTGDALGACMFVRFVPRRLCTEVVGIVENHRRQDLVEDEPHLLYFVNQAHPSPIPTLPTALMVGTTGDAEAVVDLIRDEAAAASTQIRFVNAVSMSDYIEPQMRSWRLGASMFTAFGFLALIVAGWGLYSVLAFDVALRQHELGIRSALGANMARLVRLVLRQAVLFVAAGVGIGLFASWAASRFVEPLLFQVPANDPQIYVLVAVTLLLVAVLAGSLPAWRATRVDPREALQAD